MTAPLSRTQRLTRSGASLLREAAGVCYELFKIMVPLSIATKVLEDAGAVDWLGAQLGPMMQLVGLPGGMGLVWATGAVTNIYGAMVVFAALAPETPLTVAQSTVLGTMILVAHCLPIELRIAQRAGMRLRSMLVLRVGGAILIGWALNRLYTVTGWLQTPNAALWSAPPSDPSWGAWLVSTAEALALIFGIVLGLLFLLKVLDRLGVTRLLARALEPVLRMVGISREATPIAIIGVTLGLGLGGGLIIREARSGRLGERDVVCSLALMGLCHSLIEDTLLLMSLGGHLSGLLGARVVFALVAAAVLARLVARMPDRAFHRLFFRPSPDPHGEPAS